MTSSDLLRPSYLALLSAQALRLFHDVLLFSDFWHNKIQNACALPFLFARFFAPSFLLFLLVGFPGVFGEEEGFRGDLTFSPVVFVVVLVGVNFKAYEA
jgi:hypothetical protein